MNADSVIDAREALIYEIRQALDHLCGVISIQGDPRNTHIYESCLNVLKNTKEWEFTDKAVFSIENQEKRQEYRRMIKV
jgi:hypothetical protein